MDVLNCSFTELKVQGCSVKGDIRCCKVDRDNEVESPAEFEKASKASDDSKDFGLSDFELPWLQVVTNRLQLWFLTWEVSNSDYKTFFSKII